MHGTGWTGDLVAEQGSTLLDDLFLKVETGQMPAKPPGSNPVNLATRPR